MRTEPLLQTLAWASGTLLLGACAFGPARPAAPVEAPPLAPVVIVVTPPPPAEPPPDPLAELLAYAEQLQGKTAAALAPEIARLGEAGAETPLRQLQLALALAQTQVPADTARALALAQHAANGAAPEAATLQQFARLLGARLHEQRRLEELAERQGQQLRDGQRRIEQLNERLEALRAIEHSLPATRP